MAEGGEDPGREIADIESDFTASLSSALHSAHSTCETALASCARSARSLVSRADALSSEVDSIRSQWQDEYSDVRALSSSAFSAITTALNGHSSEPIDPTADASVCNSIAGDDVGLVHADGHTANEHVHQHQHDPQDPSNQHANDSETLSFT